MLYLQNPKKITPTPIKMQQLPDIEKTDSKDELFFSKVITYNGKYVNYQTDTDK